MIHNSNSLTFQEIIVDIHFKLNQYPFPWSNMINDFLMFLNSKDLFQSVDLADNENGIPYLSGTKTITWHHIALALNYVSNVWNF